MTVPAWIIWRDNLPVFRKQQEQRLTLFTLGLTELNRSAHHLHGWGWVQSLSSSPNTQYNSGTRTGRFNLQITRAKFI